MQALILLAGAVLILRAIHRKGHGDATKDESDASSETSGIPGLSGLPSPSLDPAFTRIPAQSWGDLFASVIPGPTFQPVDSLIRPPQIPQTVLGGPPTSSQLSSANNMLNAIIGSIPHAVQMHGHAASQFGNFLERTFGPSNYSGPPVTYRIVNGRAVYSIFDPKTGQRLIG